MSAADYRTAAAQLHELDHAEEHAVQRDYAAEYGPEATQDGTR